jgi:hypothetical protein
MRVFTILEFGVTFTLRWNPTTCRSHEKSVSKNLSSVPLLPDRPYGLDARSCGLWHLPGVPQAPGDQLADGDLELFSIERAGDADFGKGWSVEHN